MQMSKQGTVNTGINVIKVGTEGKYKFQNRREAVRGGIRWCHGIEGKGIGDYFLLLPWET